MSAALRSLGIGFGAAILAMLIGTPAAFLLARRQIRGKSLLLAFVLSPIIVPRMIIAVGLFYLFARVGLVGTPIGLAIGHTVIAVPYVVMTMMAVLRNYDTRLDLARKASARRRGRRCATSPSRSSAPACCRRSCSPSRPRSTS
jgi:putative spermidine/putrescine transport system permease protein